MSRLLRILRRIGQIQAHALLTAFYLLLWLPAGLVCRLVADWLRVRPGERSGWVSRADRLNIPEHLQEPF